MNMWREGLRSAKTGARIVETMEASRSVLDSRCKTIAAIAMDPLHGDYRELGRLIPEKVDALGKAGASAWSDMAAIQSDAVANMQQAGRIILSGRLPSASDAEQLWSRSARMVERAMGAGDRAFAPLHQRVTSNARRLKRKG